MAVDEAGAEMSFTSWYNWAIQQTRSSMFEKIVTPQYPKLCLGDGAVCESTDFHGCSPHDNFCQDDIDFCFDDLWIEYDDIVGVCS